jgi:7-cyano-7-deazaguanine reductase
MTDNKYGGQEVDKMANPQNWEIWDAPKNEEVLYQFFPEFTCKCPRSGYPDFAKVHIVMVPNEKVLELKCLKLWLNSFRDIGISHENMTQTIASTLSEILGLKYIYVLMEYSPRGNLTTYPMTEICKDGYSIREEVKIIKTKLLNKII